MNLNQFYNHVARLTDTAGSKINVAETKRVLAVAFQEISKLPVAEAADVIAKGLAAGAAKNKPAKKKAAKRATKKKTSRKK